MKENPSDIRRVLETDFKKSEVQRDELKYYEPLVQRGSCRLKEGLFRTEAEQRAFIVHGKSIQLSKMGKGLHLWRVPTMLSSVLRSLFIHDATDPKCPKSP
jgi:hypothetical protein